MPDGPNRDGALDEGSSLLSVSESEGTAEELQDHRQTPARTRTRLLVSSGRRHHKTPPLLSSLPLYLIPGISTGLPASEEQSKAEKAQYI
ncbi:hypothetical protein DPEC_G00235570 [Dallia pectoralis]|uniref:Uncharacterized protein n=1 Tax=Dallia pectoralis TaxID=75939 RepID=A0ACC2FY93_DALPE|nr:hypothetical protein DPEC_G00235570 [Dallia pectoralis]